LRVELLTFATAVTSMSWSPVLEIIGSSGQGETVMVKETAVPQVGAKRFKWNGAPIPSVVQQANGDWLWLGTVWVKKGDVVLLDDAPAYFTNLVNRGTNNVVGYVMRGVSWLEKHEFDNAVKDLNAAIRLQPRNSSFYGVRGKALSWRLDQRAERPFPRLGELHAACVANKTNIHSHRITTQSLPEPDGIE
jgi:hypothetical protein